VDTAFIGNERYAHAQGNISVHSNRQKKRSSTKQKRGSPTPLKTQQACNGFLIHCVFAGFEFLNRRVIGWSHCGNKMWEARWTVIDKFWCQVSEWIVPLAAEDSASACK
jgi:hypothetical protein